MIGAPTQDASPQNRASREAVYRLRPEVRASARWRGNQRFWVLKHNAALEHFEVSEDEWFLLQQFDGSMAVEQARSRYNIKYRPRVLSNTKIHQFLHTAISAGILGVEGPGRAREISRQGRERQRTKLLTSILQVIAPRLSVCDPAPLLKRIELIPRVMFNGWFVSLTAIAAVILFTLGLGAAHEVALERFDYGFEFNQWWFVATILVWICIKAAHELSHAMACHFFGGECHDMGVFFIAGAPIMYCDVSDAWTFPSRWQRSVVSLAGVYMEALIAIVCGYLWLAVEPGALRNLLGQVVLICGVSTFIFNANPLLRLDAYYLLSDLTNRPNLFQESRQALGLLFMKWLSAGRLGQLEDQQSLWVKAYGLLSIIYRTFVLCLISYVVWLALKAVGLEPLGILFAAIAFASLFLPLMYGLFKIMRSPVAWRAIVPIRLVLLIVGGTALVWGVASLPAPNTVLTPAMVIYGKPQSIITPEAGRLISYARYGEEVAAGDQIAVIESTSLQQEMLVAQTRLTAYKLERKLLEQELVHAESTAARIESLIELEEAAEVQLAQLKERSEELVLTAEREGVVAEPEYRISKPGEGELNGWESAPLLEENDGCWLKAGDLLCEIGDANSIQLLIVLDQVQAEQIKLGAPVRARLNHYPGVTFKGELLAIGSSPVDSLPRVLLKACGDSVSNAGGGQMVPTEPLYFANARLDEVPTLALPSSIGWARVETSGCTLAEWGWREMRRVLSFSN